LISILIVNHNGGEVLPRCLGHLAQQKDAFHDVVLADNASTDGSAAEAQQLASDLGLERFQVLQLGENLGFGAANNRAAAAAEGDSLLLLNSDAWPVAGTLPKLVHALDETPRLGLAAPKLCYEDGRPQFHWAPTTGVIGEALQMLRNRLEGTSWIHSLRLPNSGWYTAACILVRRAAFESIGGFDENFFLYFEDVDFSLRLRQAGWRLRTVPDAQAVHLKGGSQGGGRQDALGSLEYRRGQLAYYAKHRPVWESRLIHRRLRRKFESIEDTAMRQRYLGLLG